MPRRKKENVTLHPTSIRIDQNLHKCLLELAEEEHNSFNGLVNTALENFIKERRKFKNNANKVIIG